MLCRFLKLMLAYLILVNGSCLTASDLYKRVFVATNPGGYPKVPVLPPPPSLFAEVKMERNQLPAHFETAEKLSQLLKLGADPNEQDPKGRTLLFPMVYGGHVKHAEILLKAGTDPNHQDKNGNTAMHWLMLNKHVLGPEWNQMLDLLLRYKANPNSKNLQGRDSVELFRMTINDILSNEILVQPESSSLHPLIWNLYAHLANSVILRIATYGFEANHQEKWPIKKIVIAWI